MQQIFSRKATATLLSTFGLLYSHFCNFTITFCTNIVKHHYCLQYHHHRCCQFHSDAQRLYVWDEVTHCTCTRPHDTQNYMCRTQSSLYTQYYVQLLTVNQLNHLKRLNQLTDYSFLLQPPLQASLVMLYLSMGYLLIV